MGLDLRKKTKAYAFPQANSNTIEERNRSSLIGGLLVGSLSRYYTSLRKCSSLGASTNLHFSCTDENEEEEITNVTSSSQGMEFNRVDCVVWVLHESARSFSQAAESIGLARSGRGLAMAWIGKDVRVWHRRIAYQVCTTKCFSSDKYIVMVLLLFTSNLSDIAFY